MTSQRTAGQIQACRDAALKALLARIPYAATLGITFTRLGDELTGELAYRPELIGNPRVPALHGGAIGAFLETAAIIELAWQILVPRLECDEPEPGTPSPPAAGPGVSEGHPAGALAASALALPRTIDLTVDYLRPGKPRDVYARATVQRAGRRYATVHAEAWQDSRSAPITTATGHFRMPARS